MSLKAIHPMVFEADPHIEFTANKQCGIGVIWSVCISTPDFTSVCVQGLRSIWCFSHTHTHTLYLVSCSQQVISHLVQVGGLACVDKAHHLFEDIWLHVIYLHTVLNGRRGQERRIHPGFNGINGERRKRQMLWQFFKTVRSGRAFSYSCEYPKTSLN